MHKILSDLRVHKFGLPFGIRLRQFTNALQLKNPFNLFVFSEGLNEFYLTHL